MLIKRSLSQTDIISTSHGTGEKRVLLAGAETETGITQIAVTKLHADEQVETHTHPTMEEFFFLHSGTVEIVIGSERIVCNAEDFIKIPAQTPHSLHAITDVELMTIGCVIG